MLKTEKLNILKKEFDENKNSHIFLVETDDSEETLKDIKELVKHILNANNIIATQIDEENYIEMIIVRPQGKDIKKDQIKELQDRIKTRPILSDYMIYIIEHAEALNETSSNKLLKTIEEPNPNVLGFMISENIDIMLPTIKSRCEKITIMQNDKIALKSDPEITKITEALIKCIESKNHMEFYKIKSDEKSLQDNHKIVANMLKDYYNTACNLQTNMNFNSEIVNFIKDNNSYKQLLSKAKYLNGTLNQLSKNMNGDLLLEKIFLELKGVD